MGYRTAKSSNAPAQPLDRSRRCVVRSLTYGTSNRLDVPSVAKHRLAPNEGSCSLHTFQIYRLNRSLLSNLDNCDSTTCFAQDDGGLASCDDHHGNLHRSPNHHCLAAAPLPSRGSSTLQHAPIPRNLNHLGDQLPKHRQITPASVVLPRLA
jgi:hypothetical protein